MSLRELSLIFQPKPEEPETTPSLREALSKPLETIDSYYITSSIQSILKEILNAALNKKGQGYWVRAEYGAGKTHTVAALTTLLTCKEAGVWQKVHDEEIRKDYQTPLSKQRLFPVTFSLLGAGEAEAGDNLMRRFEKEIRDALPPELAGKVSVLS
jgi:hypothetical protein